MGFTLRPCPPWSVAPPRARGHGTGHLVARTPFPVEVLTPEGQVFEGEVEMLSTRTEVGEIGVLANHAPLLAMLAPAELRLHLSESDVKRFAQGEGYLQVHSNHALVLVEECVEPDRKSVV